jgi:hypothetical protein
LSNFAQVITELPEQDDAPELLPLRLATACALVLNADGAGLSVTGELRVPLGASNEDAAVVERLQSTLGEGPCLSAHASQSIVLADLHQMAASWPLFHDRVISVTPYRSVGSVPLQTVEGRLGALDLYWLAPHGSATLSAADALALAAHVSEVLMGAPEVPSITGGRQPAWVAAPTAQRRLDVWQAVGLLNATGGLSPADALSILRSYAFTRDKTLDELAEELVAGRTPVDALLL